MKKLITLALAVLLALTAAAPALADLIWMPDDDFYNDHINECSYSSETYRAAVDTPICFSPQNGTRAGVIPAGETVYIDWIWTDSRGCDWGYVEYAGTEYVTKGWINVTNPGVGPAPTVLPLYMIIIVCVLALGAVGIVLFGRRKDERKH